MRHSEGGVPLGAEIALAIGTGAASFALVALTLAATDFDVVPLALGVACLGAVVAMTRWWGVAYAVPSALAALLAFDWFEFPPTHAPEFPGSADLADLFAYLAVGVFVGLVATRAARRAELSEVARNELLEEQGALRRVATLVARGPTADELFAAVAEEVGRLVSIEHTAMFRYDDGYATAVASWGNPGAPIPIGKRVTLEGGSVTGLVKRTGRSARIDDYATASGSLGAFMKGKGIRSAVASPIVVDGRLWGAMVAGSRQAEPLPPDAESRIGEFTKLVATAISNIQARAELASSRARVVAAADDERRQVVRDLHDGAQQRLVHTVVTLKLAERALEQETEMARRLVGEALHHAQLATTELRELAHGILPSVLTSGGLRAGVAALATRMPVPVETGVAVGRLPGEVEATAYFVVAEALTNVAKHSHARHAAVMACVDDGTLHVDVRDDGVGGARPDGGGLMGLADRLAVLDGRLRVESPAHGGTLIAATIPVGRSAGDLDDRSPANQDRLSDA